MTAFFAVGVGATIGAWLCWGPGLWLNPVLPAGLPEMRLFLITGLLGGLTTFSTFSAEVVGALMRGLWLTGGLIAIAHLAGSLVATGLGFYTRRLFR